MDVDDPERIDEESHARYETKVSVNDCILYAVESAETSREG